MMLEEEVHLDADASDIFEHVAELHVFWVRTKAVEAVGMLAEPGEFFYQSGRRTHRSWSSSVKTCGICANASLRWG